ncbi:ATP-binding cassette domain-containing protein [Candidatus Aalborgicola defluviihabitans]|uniref:ATP-binding cassette domain-containing protein n=1 Tax=Candidatus Aalborgicola defluviihabitans TaxID=3386187 RepID=UPI0039B966B9
MSFSYPGRQALALDAVSLQLPPGQTLGLVGATGSGKSSVLRLILRQYTPKHRHHPLGWQLPGRLHARGA